MSERKRRLFEPEFKLSAVERLNGGEPIEALAAELGVSKTHLYKWRLKLHREGVLRRAGRQGRSCAVAGETAGPQAVGDVGSAPERIAELERKIGRQQLELDFFRQALRQVGGARRPSAGLGVPTSTRSSRR